MKQTEVGADRTRSAINRREFVGMAAGAAALAAFPYSRVLGANDRIRIGLIGAGDRGQQDLKDAIAQPDVECVAVADVYSLRREQAKAIAPSAETYDDPRRLLDRKDIDAVIIATPLHLHAKYFLDSLAAGKDVYCEKTMTWDIPEAVECLHAAQKSKQVVQIGLQHESSGELADARKWYADGLLGKVTMVESWMSRNTPHGHGQWYRAIPGDCNPQHVNWDLFLVNRPKIGVRRQQVHELAAVLGVLRRQRHRKHGAPDRVDHDRNGPSSAGGSRNDGRRLFRKRWASGARHHRRDLRVPQRSHRAVAVHVQQQPLRIGRALSRFRRHR